MRAEPTRATWSVNTCGRPPRHRPTHRRWWFGSCSRNAGPSLGCQQRTHRLPDGDRRLDWEMTTHCFRYSHYAILIDPKVLYHSIGLYQTRASKSLPHSYRKWPLIHHCADLDVIAIGKAPACRYWGVAGLHTSPTRSSKSPQCGWTRLRLNAAMIRSAALDGFSCSQTLTTLQPASVSIAVCRRSRRTVSVTFSSHHALFVSGSVK